MKVINLIEKLQRVNPSFDVIYLDGKHCCPIAVDSIELGVYDSSIEEYNPAEVLEDGQEPDCVVLC